MSIIGTIELPVWIIGLIGLAVFIVMQVIFVFLHKPEKDYKGSNSEYYKDIFKASLKMMFASLLFTVGVILSIYFWPFIVVNAGVKYELFAMLLPLILWLCSIGVPMILHHEHNERVREGNTKLPLLTIPMPNIFSGDNNEKGTKKVAIEYKSIKASEIEEMVKDMGIGANVKVNEKGDVEVLSVPVMIVEDIGEASKNYELENIGIKVKGKSIYKIKGNGILVYVAKGVNKEEISEILTASKEIKEAIEERIKKETGKK